jgi:hypothetical protein
MQNERKKPEHRKRISGPCADGLPMNRVRRMRGQADAIERPLEREIICSDRLRLIARVRGAQSTVLWPTSRKITFERGWLVRDPLREPDPTGAIAAEELIEVVQYYLKQLILRLVLKSVSSFYCLKISTLGV